MQDYKVVVRALTAGATQVSPEGATVAQNFSEFTSYLSATYLSQGYKVLSVDQVRVLPGENGAPTLYEFAYHLVKDLPVKEAKAKE